MRAVIFDLDGVLVRSEPLWRQGFADVVNGFCRDQGLPDPAYAADDMRRFEGGRVSDTLRTLLAEQGYAAEPPLVHALTDAVVDRVSRAVDHERDAIADSVETARALARDGVRLAVASSSAPEFIDAAVAALGLDVEVTQSALHLEHGKPHPEVYFRVLERLGLGAADCVAVEDSVTGLVAAVRAGIDSVWLPDGDREEARAALREHGAEAALARVRLVTPRLCPEGLRVLLSA